MKSFLKDLVRPKDRGMSDTSYDSSYDRSYNRSYDTSYSTSSNLPPTSYGSSFGSSSLDTSSTRGFAQANTQQFEPTWVEKKERAPVIHETVLPQERVEIQPVIHREREQLEVHQIVQPMVERGVTATEFKTVTLPAERKAEIRESDIDFQRRYQEEFVRHKSF